MNRVIYGVIMVVVMVCFCGLVPSTAADEPKPIFGDERHGVEADTRAPNVRGTDGLNYSKEVYTAVAPSSGESYNQNATKVFSLYDTIYLTDRFYIATAGTYTRYRFITDVVGTMVAWSAESTTFNTTGHYWSWKTIIFYEVGSYVYHSLTLGPGEWVSSQQFSFIVE